MKNVTLITLLFVSTTFANESSYSSIAEKDCKVSKIYEHNMGASMACEKFEQFGVEVSDSDARMSITIKHHDIEYPQYYSSVVSPLFSSLGNKIEWRYPKGESYAPHAFIARVNVSIENERIPNGFKEISKLVVSKIDKLSICVVGVIPPQKNQNILARELSNKARTMPCLKEEQHHREEMLKKVLTHHDGLTSHTKSEESFNYVRDMGALEHTLRVLKMPSFPLWRMRLRLYPIFSEKFPSQLGGYRVKADYINLSYALHDTTLKSIAPTETYTLEYMIMRTPALFIEESIDLKYNVYLKEDACGLQKSCTQLYKDRGGDWGKETQVTLTKAPWESKVATLPAMLRVLAQKSGWLKNSVWQPPELPEGMKGNTPWVEVVIENHVGNGGGYLMEWQTKVSDDSIAKTLYRIYYDEASKQTKVNVHAAVLCSRGKNTTKPTQICQ